MDKEELVYCTFCGAVFIGNPVFPREDLDKEEFTGHPCRVCKSNEMYRVMNRSIGEGGGKRDESSKSGESGSG